MVGVREMVEKKKVGFNIYNIRMREKEKEEEIFMILRSKKKERVVIVL